MNEQYITSENIRIFPYSEDRITDPFGKYLSEHNLRNLITQFTTYDSFFVGIDELESNTSILSRRIKFCIAGHYVEFILSIDTNNIDSPANKFWLTNYIYAEVIHYNEGTDATPTYSKLWGKDTSQSLGNPTFEAVKFVAEVTPNSKIRDTMDESIEVGENKPKVAAVKTRFRLFNPIYDGDIGELDETTFTTALQSAIPDTAYERFDHNTLPPFKWYTLTSSNS